MANLQPSEPLSCLPDAFLSEEKLKACYEGFRSDISYGLPEASIFSHLVGAVRQPYTVEIIGLLKEIIRRSDQYEKRLSDMRQHYESCLGVTTSSRRLGERESTIPPADDECSSSATGRAAELLPADPVTLYVGSVDYDIRRDTVRYDREELKREGWIVRFELKCFKLMEIGTVKITTMGSKTGPVRMNAFLDTSSCDRNCWGDLVIFYAFGSWRPNTEMISVGYAENPERCIFIRGDHANKLAGWSEKFVFWVPV
ncbi:hypothetical protein DFP73DRAFT_535853 [Morchella snyderi]|nr:hypothetical protein DFP73DRAFT_535853 [Morchella snyderi]